MSYPEYDLKHLFLVHSLLFLHLCMNQRTFGSCTSLIILSETIAFFNNVRMRPAGTRKRCVTCSRLQEFLFDCEFAKQALFPHYQTFEELENSAAANCDLCQYFRSLLILNAFSYASLQRSLSPIEIGITVGGDIESFDPQMIPSSVSLELRLEGRVMVKVRGVATKSLTTASPEALPGSAGKSPRRLKRVIDIAAELQLGKEWLQDCKENHMKCTNESTGRPPARLLDVGDASKRPSLFIVNTDPALNPVNRAPEYCALSYCWGVNSSHGIDMGLTKDKQTRYKEGIHWEELPRTIQDAIVITRSLDVRYLWVDALCIIQPRNGDDADWCIESAHMGDIYRNAVCTISAQGASNANEGCFFNRNWKDYSIGCCTLRRTKTSEGVLWPFILPPLAPDDTSIEHAPLNNRAWALQERYLSSRLLYWTKHRLFWECKTCRHPNPSQRLEDPSGTDCKGWSDDFRDTSGMLSRRRLQTMGDDFWFLWVAIVMDYSYRKMKKRSDRLIALSGVASMFQPHAKSEYLAGLWKAALPYGLLWCYEHTSTNLDDVEPTLDYVAPSWSWASRPHSVGFVTYSVLTLPQVMFNSTRTSTELSSNDPFGAVRGGQLCLKAPLIHLKVATGTEIRESPQDVDLLHPPCGPGGFARLAFDEIPSTIRESMLCAFVTWSWVHGYNGLILEPICKIDRAYRRIGLVFLRLEFTEMLAAMKSYEQSYAGVYQEVNYNKNAITKIDPYIECIEEILIL